MQENNQPAKKEDAKSRGEEKMEGEINWGGKKRQFRGGTFLLSLSGFPRCFQRETGERHRPGESANQVITCHMTWGRALSRDPDIR